MTARRGGSLLRVFNGPISLSILRIAYQWDGVPQQVVDDLVQETYLKLCADKLPLLLGFAVRHPEAAVGYMKTIAVNVARDHFKSRYRRSVARAKRISFRMRFKCGINVEDLAERMPWNGKFLSKRSIVVWKTARLGPTGNGTALSSACITSKA